MPKNIDRDEVRRLQAAGAQLVEVMPADEYEQLHLRGAISLPLKDLDTASAGSLDRSRPVVVYCYDLQ